MFCCACSGSCSHTGPHTYCYEHSPSRYVPTAVLTASSRCEHCYCEPSVARAHYARCCKCGDEMHDQFIARQPTKWSET